MKKKGKILCFGLFLTVSWLFSGVLHIQAQPYPNRSITVVLPTAPGDASDISGRLVIEELEKNILKVPMIPLNKPGAGAAVATDFVAKSKKDGYTLLYGSTSGIVYNPVFNADTIPYDPIRDLEPLGLHVCFPDAISVQAESPWKTFADVIEYAKKNPGKFRVGTLGVGSINHFRLEMIKSWAGVDIPMIPFKGAVPAVTAVLGGHIEAAFVAISLTDPHYQSGKLRPILVDQKVDRLPNVPTLQDLGFKRALPLAFFGFFAPSGIPEEVRKVLIPAIEKATRNPESRAKLQSMWFIPRYKSAEEFKQTIVEDTESAKQIVKQMGITK